MLIHGQDMLLPTTMVGNYPNPRWYDGHGFATLPKGEFIHDSISKEAFEDAVGAIVHDQEAAGFDVKGEVIGWLNSDDAYCDCRTVEWIVDLFQANPDVDVRLTSNS